MTGKPRVPDQPYHGDDADGGPSPTFQADAMGSTIIAYLVTGPALFGGLGWLVDRALGADSFPPGFPARQASAASALHPDVTASRTGAAR